MPSPIVAKIILKVIKSLLLLVFICSYGLNIANEKTNIIEEQKPLWEYNYLKAKYKYTSEQVVQTMFLWLTEKVSYHDFLTS